MPPRRLLAAALADAALAGPWDAASIARRARETLGSDGAWSAALARSLVTATGPRAPVGDRDVVVELVERWLRRHVERASDDSRLQSPLTAQVLPGVRRWMLPEQSMRAVGDPAGDLGLPALPTQGDLAQWLGVSIGDLLWFADLRGTTHRADDERLRHYRYEWRRKRAGSRLIEIPKPRLKALQRQLLARLLDLVPPHSAAHGFVSGRSPVTFARPHVARAVVIRVDLADFFAHVRAARVRATFATLGYPRSVAETLAALMTNTVPGAILRAAPTARGEALTPAARAKEWQRGQLFRTRHLPQGAPTSPALANLAAFGLDCRLAGLARSLDATYTRYADDLAFSGGDELARRADAFVRAVARIARAEGFAVRPDKTRVMRRGARQHLAGLVVNERLSVPRDALERLEATLTNCVRRGPAGENRDGHEDFRAHLAGRIAWVEQVEPARAVKLRTLFARIAW